MALRTPARVLNKEVRFDLGRQHRQLQLGLAPQRLRAGQFALAGQRRQPVAFPLPAPQRRPAGQPEAQRGAGQAVGQPQMRAHGVFAAGPHAVHPARAARSGLVGGPDDHADGHHHLFALTLSVDLAGQFGQPLLDRFGGPWVEGQQCQRQRHAQHHRDQRCTFSGGGPAASTHQATQPGPEEQRREQLHADMDEAAQGQVTAAVEEYGQQRQRQAQQRQGGENPGPPAHPGRAEDRKNAGSASASRGGGRSARAAGARSASWRQASAAGGRCQPRVTKPADAGANPAGDGGHAQAAARELPGAFRSGRETVASDVVWVCSAPTSGRSV